jgi:hypothetical protein
MCDKISEKATPLAKPGGLRVGVCERWVDTPPKRLRAESLLQQDVSLLTSFQK